MQEGVAGPVGELHESESLVGIVPFDYGFDRRTGEGFKPLGAKLRCGSETTPGCFEVVVIEAAATGRTKISVSAAHVIPWGRVERSHSEMRRNDRQRIPRRR